MCWWAFQASVFAGDGVKVVVVLVYRTGRTSWKGGTGQRLRETIGALPFPALCIVIIVVTMMTMQTSRLQRVI